MLRCGDGAEYAARLAEGAAAAFSEGWEVTAKSRGCWTSGRPIAESIPY
jgi:hypothetical protein